MIRQTISLKLSAFIAVMLLLAVTSGFVKNGNFGRGAYIDGNDIISMERVKVETLYFSSLEFWVDIKAIGQNLYRSDRSRAWE